MSAEPSQIDVVITGPLTISPALAAQGPVNDIHHESPERQVRALLAILAERSAQMERWGGLDHDGRTLMGSWLAILGKQYGHVAEVLLGSAADPYAVLTADMPIGLPTDQRRLLRHELTQLAAVCVALLEAIPSPRGDDPRGTVPAD